jgi:hypothetical protein
MRPLLRFIRLRDAPEYLGMDCNRFNTEVPPLSDPDPNRYPGDRLRPA